MYSSTLSFNLGAEGGWLFNATPRPLYPRQRNPVLIVQEAMWAPGPVWTSAGNLALTGIRSPNSPAHNESVHSIRYPDPA